MTKKGSDVTDEGDVTADPAVPGDGIEGDPLPPLYVLVAEDVKVNRMVVKALLERDGHVATLAADGREAVAALREQDFDLILMDVQMPIMDGVEATRHIRAMPEPRKARTPILAMTANLLHGDADRCTAAGMTGILVKPVNPVALNGALQRLFAIDGPPPAPTPTTPLPDSDRVFDDAPVSQLLEVLPPAKVASLLDGAKVSIAGAHGALTAAWTADDRAAMETHAHKLAGVAGVFGCLRLMTLARRIEAVARTDPSDLMAGLEGTLNDAFAALDGEQAKIG